MMTLIKYECKMIQLTDLIGDDEVEMKGRQHKHVTFAKLLLVAINIMCELFI